MLLISLPDTWSTFITTINASGALITSETLIAQTLDEDCMHHAGSSKQTALQEKGQKLKPEQSGHHQAEELELQEGRALHWGFLGKGQLVLHSKKESIPIWNYL